MRCPYWRKGRGSSRPPDAKPGAEDRARGLERQRDQDRRLEEAPDAQAEEPEAARVDPHVQRDRGQGERDGVSLRATARETEVEPEEEQGAENMRGPRGDPLRGLGVELRRTARLDDIRVEATMGKAKAKVLISTAVATPSALSRSMSCIGRPYPMRGDAA